MCVDTLAREIGLALHLGDDFRQVALADGFAAKLDGALLGREISVMNALELRQFVALRLPGDDVVA